MSEEKENSELGILRSIMITHDDQGIEVLRATVDFYNGAAPNVKFSCVWEQSPVRIIEVKDAEFMP